MRKKKNEGDAGTKKRGVSGNQRDILISAIFSISAILGAFYWVTQVEQPRAMTQRITAVTGSNADHQAVVIRNLIQRMRARVASQAEHSGLTQLAASSPNSDTLKIYEESLRSAFPEAVSAQLIHIGPQGIADEKSQTDRLRNHIEIDLLSKTLTSKDVAVEAYSAQDTWLISFSQQVSPQLAVFVSFPASYFRSLLTGLAGEAFNHQLVQTYKKRREVVIAANNTEFKQYMESRPLPVPGWTVEVFPQQALIRSLETDTTLLWLVCLLCVALISASHAVFLIRSRSIPQSAPPAKKTIKTKAPAAVEPQPLPAAPSPTKAPTPSTSEPPPLPELDEGQATGLALSAFRAYDIRGRAERDLNDRSCELIGRAIGSEALARGESKILLGRDGRLSSPRIRRSLLTGLQSTGVNVIDLGLIATPMLQFACRELNIGNGVMITGSHNPGDHNGMKIYLQYNTLAEDDIQALRRRIEDEDFSQGEGSLSQDTIQQRYINRIARDVVLAHPLKVVIDAGNGATSDTAPELFEELGCEVIPLFCEVDGNFPNHPPDPTIPANLSALQAAVAKHKADIGLAFDGDGDRLAVVSAGGRCPAADQLLMVLAEDVVNRNPGSQIIFDIKCSRLLHRNILELGGRPLMWKSGHAFMKQKMLETGAPLGGEFSGHIFFNERWYGFDDGMYTAARLLEALSLGGTTLDAALENLGSLFATGEILLPVADEKKFELIEAFKARQDFSDASITDIDGVRADFRSGWGLIRASNTGPAISLRFEADSETALQGIRNRFRGVLAEIDPTLADGL